MVILDEGNWTVVKEDAIVTVMYLLKTKMVIHPGLIDLAEIGFLVTNSGDLQITMAGQPIIVLFGRREK